MNQELSGSPFYDPNLDYVGCLYFTLVLTLCSMCIMIPIVSVLLASSTDTNWFIWIFCFVVFILVTGVAYFFIYRKCISTEEQRMIRREKDFSNRLDKINRVFRENGEDKSWETGPRGAYLQFNKNRSSDQPVVIRTPVAEPVYF